VVGQVALSPELFFKGEMGFCEGKTQGNYSLSKKIGSHARRIITLGFEPSRTGGVDGDLGEKKCECGLKVADKHNRRRKSNCGQQGNDGVANVKRQAEDRGFQGRGEGQDFARFFGNCTVQGPVRNATLRGRERRERHKAELALDRGSCQKLEP